MGVEMGQKLVLGIARADQQPLVHTAQAIDDAIEKVAIEMAMAGADHAGLVMDLAKRAVCLDALFVHILGVEAEDVGLLRIHPDDCTAVRHRMLQVC